jgi:hypothetical protein
MGLTSNQKMAIRLLNDGVKAEAVIRQLNIPRYALQKWTDDPLFNKERYNDIMMRFGYAVPKAMSTLMEILDGGEGIRAGDRIKAAVEILDRAGLQVRKDINVNVTDNRKALDMDASELRAIMSELHEAKKMIDATPVECEDITNRIESGEEDVNNS